MSRIPVRSVTAASHSWPRNSFFVFVACFKFLLCIFLSSLSSPWKPPFVSSHCLLSSLQFLQYCPWMVFCWWDECMLPGFLSRTASKMGPTLTLHGAEGPVLWITPCTSKWLIPPPSLPEVTGNSLFTTDYICREKSERENSKTFVNEMLWLIKSVNNWNSALVIDWNPSPKISPLQTYNLLIFHFIFWHQGLSG